MSAWWRFTRITEVSKTTLDIRKTYESIIQTVSVSCVYFVTEMNFP